MGLAGSEIKYICLFWCNSRVRWEYAPRINDPVYLFVMYSTSHPLVRRVLPSRCHLHFVRIHYRAATVCIAFIHPQAAPHMEITRYIPAENIALGLLLH